MNDHQFLFKKVGIGFFVLLFFLNTGHANRWKPLGQQTSSKSPDGRFTALIPFSIRDNRTGELAEDLSVLPSYAMFWGNDSKNLVHIGMISCGYEATVFHFNGATWEDMSLTGMGQKEPYRWSVLEVKFVGKKRGNIQIARLEQFEDPAKPNRRAYLHYLATYVVDPESKKILSRKDTSITEEKYLRLRY